jgi:hypothetical protein
VQAVQPRPVPDQATVLAALQLPAGQHSLPEVRGTTAGIATAGSCGGQVVAWCCMLPYLLGKPPGTEAPCSRHPLSTLACL